ncbi:hypothetical protein PIB30_034082 [Stylosanthes scabra]|uniref:Uncharacterized protein n=1 Tax=Stylosanthes scabra TaxID=79078 RepID=A0ABU6QC47_9FABA|nr:hypothetical protein [Stylosanthes scabra]
MREFTNLELIPERRYITDEVMETIRVPRVVQQHQPRNEDEDHEMPQYVPENETDFGNLQHEQQHHQFQQPPQQQYHHQQLPYEDYHQFQQTMMEQHQQGFNSINEMLAGMQLQQQNMFQGLQATQNQYLEELRALKTRQDEFFSNRNNQYHMIRQEQNLMAKKIQDLKKYQVNTTMMGANKNEIDQLVSKETWPRKLENHGKKRTRAKGHAQAPTTHAQAWKATSTDQSPTSKVSRPGARITRPGVSHPEFRDPRKGSATSPSFQVCPRLILRELDPSKTQGKGNLTNAVPVPPICLRVNLSPMVKVSVSEKVVRVSESESELDQLKGLLSDASFASSARRLACLARLKVHSISGSNNNKLGSECDLSIHITIHK